MFLIEIFEFIQHSELAALLGQNALIYSSFLFLTYFHYL